MPPSMAMVNPRKIDEFGFYSKAEELANTIKQNKGKGSDFKNFYIGKGISNEELNESGLTNLFKNDSVTKSEIVNTIKENKVQFIENVKIPNAINVKNSFIEQDKKISYEAFGKNFEGVPFKNKNTGFTVVETSVGRLTFRPEGDITDVTDSLEAQGFKTNADLEDFTNYVKSDGTPYKSADEFTLAQLDSPNVGSKKNPTMKLGEVKYGENTKIYDDDVNLLEINGEINTHLPSGNKIVTLFSYNNSATDLGDKYLTFRKDANVNDWKSSEEAKDYKDIMKISENKEINNDEFFNFLDIAAKNNDLDARGTLADIVNENLTIVDVAEIITSRNEMFVRAQRIAEQTLGANIKNPADSNWDNMKQKGGTNYQEHLLRSPSKNPKALEYDTDGNLKDMYDAKYDFRNLDHYDEMNIIASMRTTDRLTPDGKKVLYVEEFQGDHAQQGRDKGFRLEGDAKEKAIQQINDFKKNEFQDFKKEKMYLTKDEFNNYNYLKNLDEGKVYNINEPFVYETFDGKFSLTIEDYYKFEQARARQFYHNQFKDQNLERFTLDKPIDDDTLMQMIIEGGDAKGIYSDSLSEIFKLQQQLKNPDDYIPAAPYVTDTKSWTKLGVKRLMQKANEGNYDYVAFSPGKIQVDRWEEEGLLDHYDNIIPSVSKTVAGKNNTGNIDVIIDKSKSAFTQPIKTPKSYNQKTFAIDMNPQVKDKINKGLSLFGIGGATAIGLEEQIGALGNMPNGQLT
tara:strand:- start:33 stop:2249 length:2217 start_codon:yes stop_codon:yes gene_type:complete